MSAARILPGSGCPGVALGIKGEGFAVRRENNGVTVGGA
jgi:hypothetical protein